MKPALMFLGCVVCLEITIAAAIYGTDDRKEYYEISAATGKSNADSVAIIVEGGAVKDNGDGTTTLSTSPYAENSAVYCPDVKFRFEPVAHVFVCSSFLVGPDLLVTARHCLQGYSSAEIANLRVIFGFKKSSSGAAATTTFPNSQIYRIAQVIGGNTDAWLVRLNRAVPSSYKILPVRRTGVVGLNNSLYVLGYPEGLSLKYSDNATARSIDAAGFAFSANLDLFGGNSGGPVFNSTTNEVEGMVSGNGAGEDWIFDVARRCYRPATYLNDSSGLPSAVQTTMLTHLLPKDTQTAVGHWHSCTLRSDRTVRCWGDNSSGQLGNGTWTSSPSPVAVSGISNAVEIVAGSLHTCALLSDRTIKCWGYNGNGQLGDGTRNDSSVPKVVAGFGGAAQLDGGGEHTCARHITGSVYCWGDNEYGQLGDGTFTDHLTATRSLLGYEAIDVTTGAFHTCAAMRNKTARCFGFGGDGEIGDGNWTYKQPMPQRVASLTDVLKVEAGQYFTGALREAGSVQCWGDNTWGNLGNDSYYPSATPSHYVGNLLAVMVFAGGGHACLRDLGGQLFCWGDNANGQLGIGSTGGSRAGPVRLSTITSVVDYDLGLEHSCARTLSGSRYCWGDNYYGQLGNSTPADSNVPTRVNGL